MDKQTNAGDSELTPLEGEQGIPSVQDVKKSIVSPKVFFGVLALVLSLGFAGYAAVHSLTSPDKKKVEKELEKKGPVAASEKQTSKKFDPSSLPPGAPLAPEPQPQVSVRLGSTENITKVPALEVDEAANVDPIGIRSTNTKTTGGAARNVSAPTAKLSPLDSSAVITLISNTEHSGNVGASGSYGQGGDASDDRAAAARERLAGLQDTMKGLVGNLSKITAPQPTAPEQKPTAAEPPPRLGGQLVASKTPRVSALPLGNRSLLMPKGTTFTCALKTRIVSEQSGFVSCQVLRNVYSDDGRVLLVDRGSHMDGEYVAKYRQGQTRIFVVWSRLRTSTGVTVDIESPATGELGEAGVDGYVDNHWTERFGAAMLLSIIDDAVKISVAKQTGPSSTIIAGDTGNTMAKVAEKMLDSTVNIPPTIYKNQGEVVGIYVSKDVDFSNVYELRTAER